MVRTVCHPKEEYQGRGQRFLGYVEIVELCTLGDVSGIVRPVPINYIAIMAEGGRV